MSVHTGLGPHHGILRRLRFRPFTALVAAILTIASIATAQEVNPQDFKPSPELLNALGRLFQKVQQGVQFPPDRSRSRLLPLLPQSTLFYFAISNYGETSHQAWAIFQQELEEDADLRAWWRRVQTSMGGAKVEDYLEKYYQLSQYLGDELVLAGTADGSKDGSFLILSEVRKPGTKAFLEQMAKEFSAKAKTTVRIYDLQELAAVKETPGGENLSILVLPEYVVGAFDVATLHRFNAQLEKNGEGFASTPPRRTRDEGL